jgi:hypothetical protein
VQSAAAADPALTVLRGLYATCVAMVATGACALNHPPFEAPADVRDGTVDVDPPTPVRPLDGALPDVAPDVIDDEGTLTDDAPAVDAPLDDVSPPPDAVVDVGPVCAPGETLCGAACVDLARDAAHCGACDRACPAGAPCAGGVCGAVAPCGLPRVQCGTACVDPLTDPSHCGRCGRACATGQLCVATVCVCPPLQIVCGGRCVDPLTDGANCGRCGGTCGRGQTCTFGVCVCPPGQLFCGTGPMARCTDVSRDDRNCAGCGRMCMGMQRCMNFVCR